MNVTQWVVDTNVIVGCDNLKNDWSEEAIALLQHIYDSGSIAVDSKRIIVRQYEARMCYPGHAANWWARMIRNAKIHFQRGEIPSRHVQLSKILSQKDHPFAGVAIGSRDKIIVTEDNSDFNCDVCDYLDTQCGVKVVGATKAYALRAKPREEW